MPGYAPFRLWPAHADELEYAGLLKARDGVMHQARPPEAPGGVKCWMAGLHTNGWPDDERAVAQKWAAFEAQLEQRDCAWSNFQGDGISWEYPANPFVTARFEQFVRDRHLTACAAGSIDCEFLKA